MPRALDAIGAQADPFVDPGQDVLQGPDVPVPSVVGTSVDDAEERLSEAGLTLTVSDAERFAPGVPNGLVAAQQPRPGAQLPTGSAVTVFTSTGFGRGDGDDGDRRERRDNDDGLFPDLPDLPDLPDFPGLPDEPRNGNDGDGNDGDGNDGGD